MKDYTKEVLSLTEQADPDHPITSREIEMILSISGSYVRDCVRDLRRKGIPICMISNSKSRRGGYFWSDNPYYTDRMIGNIKGRIISLSTTLALYEKNRNKKERQPELFSTQPLTEHVS